MKVERLGHGFLRRPCREGAPFVAARFKHGRFRRFEIAEVFQIVRKERRLNLLTVVLAGCRLEIDRADLLTWAVAPSTMPPRPDDNRVFAPRVMLLELAVDRQRSIKIFLIPPTADTQRRHRHAFEIRLHRLLLPERIVVRMLGEIGPRWKCLVLQIARLHVRERAQREIPVVRVVLVEGEVGVLLAGLRQKCILESVTQAECAVVMEVVTQKHVGWRRLRTHSFECGMRIEHPHRRGPSIVGHTKHANAPIVFRHVRQQPLDRVVRIGAFVDRILRSVQRPRGTLHHECSVRLVAPSDIFEHEDVAVCCELLVAAAQARRLARNTVGRALQQKRQWVDDVLRRKHFDMQRDTVAHRQVVRALHVL